MCIRAKAIRSRAVIEGIAPAGPLDRVSAQKGAGLLFDVRVALDVPHSGALHDRLIGPGRCVGQADVVEEVLSEARIVGLPTGHLDEPTEQALAGVAGREQPSARKELSNAAEGSHETLDAIVASPNVCEDVTLETGCVTMELPNRDRS